MAEEEKSVTWVVVAGVVFVAAMGWGFLAGSYTGAHSTALSEMNEEQRQDLAEYNRRQRRPNGVGRFVATAFEQLPNLPSVISWHFSNRIWLPILIALTMAGVVGGGFALKKLERNLSRPGDRRRR